MITEDPSIEDVKDVLLTMSRASLVKTVLANDSPKLPRCACCNAPKFRDREPCHACPDINGCVKGLGAQRPSWLEDDELEAWLDAIPKNDFDLIHPNWRSQYLNHWLRWGDCKWEFRNGHFEMIP